MFFVDQTLYQRQRFEYPQTGPLVIVGLTVDTIYVPSMPMHSDVHTNSICCMQVYHVLSVVCLRSAASSHNKHDQSIVAFLKKKYKNKNDYYVYLYRACACVLQLAF